MQKHIGGGVAIFALLAVLFTATAAAQSPTVTPWPAAVATATAAAGLQQQANAQRAQANETQRRADSARAQADALQRQAAASQAAADAAYSAAAQAASDARAALAAQQASIAGEAIGRAEASISEGKAQLASINDVVNQLRSMLDVKIGTEVSLTLELQQARADKQTVVNAYNASIAQQEQNDKNSTLLSIFSGFLIAMFLLGLLAFAVYRIRQRANDEPRDTPHDTIDGEYRINEDSEP